MLWGAVYVVPRDPTVTFVRHEDRFTAIDRAPREITISTDDRSVTPKPVPTLFVVEAK